MKMIIDPRLQELILYGQAPVGLAGAFQIVGPSGDMLRIVSSGPARDPEEDVGWEHVSVSLKNRCPYWEEMRFVKDIFWREDELVLQFHPPKAEYVNIHPNVLHLWKSPQPVNLPPKEFV